ncbi:MAG: hypothetical protein HUJ73_06940 [Eubacterium sp.]|nr:hypothetical protein [Eubacterium sp.]
MRHGAGRLRILRNVKNTNSSVSKREEYEQQRSGTWRIRNSSVSEREEYEQQRFETWRIRNSSVPEREEYGTAVTGI